MNRMQSNSIVVVYNKRFKLVNNRTIRNFLLSQLAVKKFRGCTHTIKKKQDPPTFHINHFNKSWHCQVRKNLTDFYLSFSSDDKKSKLLVFIDEKKISSSRQIGCCLHSEKRTQQEVVSTIDRLWHQLINKISATQINHPESKCCSVIDKVTVKVKLTVCYKVSNKIK